MLPLKQPTDGTSGSYFKPFTGITGREGGREAAWPSGQGGGLGIRQPGFNSRPVLVTRQSRVSSPRPRL